MKEEKQCTNAHEQPTHTHHLCKCQSGCSLLVRICVCVFGIKRKADQLCCRTQTYPIYEKHLYLILDKFCTRLLIAFDNGMNEWRMKVRICPRQECRDLRLVLPAQHISSISEFLSVFHHNMQRDAMYTAGLELHSHACARTRLCA